MRGLSIELSVDSQKCELSTLPKLIQVCLFASLLQVDAGRYLVVVFQDINPHPNQEEQARKPQNYASFETLPTDWVTVVESRATSLANNTNLIFGKVFFY